MQFFPKAISLLFLTLTTIHLSAQKHFTWTKPLKEAYQQAISLRFQAAESTLRSVEKTDPDNLLRLHVENYLDFFRVYINEEYDEYTVLEKNKDRRLSQIESYGDPKSPYYLYLQADIRLQWALARLKFEEYTTAFFETNKAFKLLTANASKFPDFLPNKKNLGVLHAMVGTIPDNYKWAVEWFSSMNGTLEQGMEELEEVIAYAQRNEFIYEDEIYVYYAYLLLHLGNETEEAWRLINTSRLDPKNNPLACFIKANVAMRTDRGDDAIAILTQRPMAPEFYPFPYLDYMTGIVKLQRLDRDADQYFLQFIKNYKGRNFIKDTYQKLAWSQLLKGKEAAYRTYMERCKSEGYTVVGSDQSAYQEAKKEEVPQVELLKSRLLFDGGRFQKAYEILSAHPASGYTAKKDILEYNYRMGRVLHKMGRLQEALTFYQKTIDVGKTEPWYYACRAALEQGIIHEESGDPMQAKSAFSLCLDISPQDHKTGLHQQARAGLKRLKN